MLNQRRIRRITIRKLDHPLLAADVDKRLGTSTAHGGTRGDQSLLRLRHSLVVLHLANELLNLIGIRERRQRTQSPRQIFRWRG